MTVSYGIAGNELSACGSDQRHDGFKSLDGDGSDTGFDIADYLVKVGWMGIPNSSYSRRSIPLKPQTRPTPAERSRFRGQMANRRYRMTALVNG